MTAVIEKNLPTEKTKEGGESDTATTSCHCPEILVVDDDAMNIYSLQTLLKSLGYMSDSAYNGLQAIQKIEKRLEKPCEKGCTNYKLVFLDYEMPIKNGIETAHYLTEKMEAGILPKFKMIGCTGHEDDDSKQRGYNAGMAGIIPKPINKGTLNEIVSAELRGFDSA